MEIRNRSSLKQMPASRQARTGPAARARQVHETAKGQKPRRRAAALGRSAPKPDEQKSLPNACGYKHDIRRGARDKFRGPPAGAIAEALWKIEAARPEANFSPRFPLVPAYLRELHLCPARAFAGCSISPKRAKDKRTDSAIHWWPSRTAPARYGPCTRPDEERAQLLPPSAVVRTRAPGRNASRQGQRNCR